MSVAHIPSAGDPGGPSPAHLPTPAGQRDESYWTDADRASISRYLASADQMAGFSGVVWKVCLALIVLILAAWVLGLLPLAVPLL